MQIKYRLFSNHSAVKLELNILTQNFIKCSQETGIGFSFVVITGTYTRAAEEHYSVVILNTKDYNKYSLIK